MPKHDDDNTDIERITDRLERIATALEEIATLLLEPDEPQPLVVPRHGLPPALFPASADPTLWDFALTQQLFDAHRLVGCDCPTCRWWSAQLTAAIQRTEAALRRVE